ncbi:L-threonine 3-dehydrogenase [Bacillus canaveralius]|uniref:L-threonine 3-dehydrogenase n=1 Tax=Bacillus canaveralius TaxID=1403243 RepID=A0A2N5GGG7_9BACI|nr:zinc-binding dehydrogenase [Bacillus canaveralius]PLR79790.1 L-threonine 3-dehydrogenase [Bacillus canaveralius]PLR88289.1 L-threonine 3-dehydrogenase [Bacillus canaveralius]
MESVCVTLSGTRKFETMSRELRIEDDEILVKTTQASICDADLRAWLGMHMPNDLPSFSFIGHEGGGEVVAIGKKVREFKVGDKVMAFGPLNTFSNYFKGTVDQCFKVPDGLDVEVACLGEPTCVGIYGVFHSGVQLGDVVLVAGLNFQGLIAVQGLKKRGANKVIAVDYSDAHLELAKKCGADVILNSRSHAVYEEIAELTKGRGVDVSLHSCGYWNPLTEDYFNMCIEVTRDEGIVTSLPDIMSPIKANLHRLHHHAMEIRFNALMHHGAEFLKRWVPRLMRPVVQGDIDIKSLITASYSMSEVDEAMKKFNEDEDQVKILLKP